MIDINTISKDHNSPTWVKVGENNYKVFYYNGSLVFQYPKEKRRLHYMNEAELIQKGELLNRPAKKTPTFEELKKQFIKKIHPNAWVAEKKQWAEYKEDNKNSTDMDMIRNKKYRYINNIWPNCNDQIKRAFEGDKSLFKERKGVDGQVYGYFFFLGTSAKSPSGRDLTLEIKLMDDGTVRAWFSSEYYNCGNGDYYLLLNPSLAVYYEAD